MNGRIIKSALLVASFCVSVGYAQDSLNVRKVGQLYNNETWGWIYDVTVSGSYAYLADYYGDLRVMDISNPAAPIELGHCEMPAQAYGLTISGSYVYVADYVSGLCIVDVSNPAQPVLVGQCDTPGSSQNVAVSGSYAYVADGESYLLIVDVSNPTAPAEVGYCGLPGTAYDVVISGDFAYVSGYGLCVVDISDPSAPVLIGSRDLPGNGHGLTLVGAYAYVAVGYAGLYIVDVSNPAALVVLGNSPTGEQLYDVKVSGQYAFMAQCWSGLVVIDVADPTAPTPVSSCDIPGPAHGVSLSSSFAYVADGEDGLRVVDISNPTAPIQWAWYQAGWISGVAVSGSYAYFADGCLGLRVVDVSNPAAPVEVGYCPTWDYAVKVALSGQYAYVAAWSEGLRIIDVSNPASPVEVGYFDTPWTRALAVAISGQYAYLVDYVQALPPFGYLYIVDISNPTLPSLVGQYQAPDPASGVAVAGGYAYVADRYEGLRIIDVSNPASPVEVGFCNSHEAAVDVALNGSFAYVADEYWGLQTIDISLPTRPFEVWNYFTEAGYGVTVSERYLYASNPYVQIFDLSNPAAPNLLGWYNNNGRDLAVSGGYIYQAEGNSLGIYQYSPPTLSLVITPVNPPVYIPASGGTFHYNATIGNDSTVAVNLSAWIRVKLPNGSWLPSPVLGPLPLTIPGGTSITRLRSQAVPANAPEGTYTYCGYIGNYPATVLDSCYFTFYKSPYGDGDPGTGGDWTCSGEPFSGEINTIHPQPTAFSFSNVSPNPFNPTTVLSFELPAASYVRLEVFDVNGRVVGAWHAVPVGFGESDLRWYSAGSHQITFDGADLPSGLYFARLTAGDFSQVQKIVLLK